jgi:molybdenum cofactor cytidylyltransferase
MISVADAAAVILAAGTGSRFGSGKVRAPLHGRPLLAHVLGAVHEAGIRRAVVVLGRDARATLDAVRAVEPGALDSVLVAVNPSPERGLATSLRLGFGVATAAPQPAGVMVLLADQPCVRAEVLRALCLSATPGDGLAVVPRYALDATPNPVLLLPAGWPLVAEASGGRGLAPLLATDLGRVVRVAVTGANPDVDTQEELAALAAVTDPGAGPGRSSRADPAPFEHGTGPRAIPGR